MDKRDLLRSFSKVHNKKLNLLENFDQRSADAANAIRQAIPQISTGAKGIVGVNNLEVAIGGPAGGGNFFIDIPGVRGRIGVSPQGELMGSKPAVKSAHTRLLGKEEDNQGTVAGQPAEVQPVINPEVDELLTKLGANIYDPQVVAPFVNLIERAKEAQRRATGLRGGRVEGSFGGQAQRLVKSLVNDFPTIVQEGEFFRVETKQSNLERATSLAEVLNSTKSDDFCDKFKKTNRGDVVVYTDAGEGSQGTVFSTGQAKLISQMIMDCDQVEEINVIKEASNNTGGESNTRGNVLEYPPDLFALARTYFKNKNSLSSSESEKAKKLIENVATKIEAGIRELNVNREEWLKAARDSAVPIEDQAEFEQILGLLEDNASNIKASFLVATASNRERLPDLSVRAGEVTGQGRKQDSVEIWYNEEKAKKALGVDNVKPVDSKEFFESLNKGDYYQELVEARFLTSGQQIYVGEISYKNYILNADTVMGSFSDNNTVSFMSGRSGNPVWARFKDAIGSKTMAENRKEFDNINKQQEQIRKDINSLSNEIDTVVKGKKVSVAALNQVVDGVLQKIERNSTFNERKRNELAEALRRKTTAYKNAKTPGQKKRIEAEMKEALLMPSLIANLKKIGSDNKAVQIYALGLQYAAGASQSNDTVLQTNMLNEGVSFITTQNKLYKEIADSIRLNNDSFELNFTQAGLAFRRRRNKAASMSLSMVRGRLQAKKSGTLTREGRKLRFLGANDERQTARESLIWDSLNKIQEALGIIKEKVRVLDTQ